MVSAGLAAVAFALAGCASAGSSARCDAQAFRAAQHARADRTEVTVCGTVIGVGRVRRSRGGAHRSFSLDVGGNDRVEIDANVDVMGDLPIRRGQTAMVRGEYYADASGRDGVHWTHRTLRGRHPAGYIVLDGTLYQ